MQTPDSDVAPRVGDETKAKAGEVKTLSCSGSSTSSLYAASGSCLILLPLFYNHLLHVIPQSILVVPGGASSRRRSQHGPLPLLLLRFSLLPQVHKLRRSPGYTSCYGPGQGGCSHGLV